MIMSISNEHMMHMFYSFVPYERRNWRLPKSEISQVEMFGLD